MRMDSGSGIPCGRAFLEVRRYLLPKRIYHRRKMKVARRTAQAFASMVVLSLLMSASVFAYTTRMSHISSFASPPAAADASTTTTSETEHENAQVTQSTHTSQNEGQQGEHLLEFKLVNFTATAAGKGDSEVQINGTNVRVLIQVEHAIQSAQYRVDLVVSQTPTFIVSSAFCSGTLGNFVTSDEGEAEVKLSMILSTGTPFLGLVLCTNGIPALVSDPLTRQATITPRTNGSDSEETHQINAKQEDQDDESQIKTAEDTKQIPDVVQVSGSGSTITQLDPKFSVSVSRPSDNSLVVSISGANITGPRVLLISLTKDAGALASPGSLSVKFDGTQVAEASSASQIFSGTSASPPSFIVLLTSSGADLLVFVPHFSAHLIEMLAAAPAGAFAAEAPLLLAAFVALTALSAVAYMRRKRFAAPAAP